MVLDDALDLDIVAESVDVAINFHGVGAGGFVWLEVGDFKIFSYVPSHSAHFPLGALVLLHDLRVVFLHQLSHMLQFMLRNDGIVLLILPRALLLPELLLRCPMLSIL